MCPVLSRLRRTHARHVFRGVAPSGTERGAARPEGRSFLRQWRSILPISDESLIDRVSLGEAETPLLPSHRYGEKLGIPDLYFKVEQGPTLSLKDRGTALCVLKALEFGCEDRVPVLVRQQRGQRIRLRFPGRAESRGLRAEARFRSENL